MRLALILCTGGLLLACEGEDESRTEEGHEPDASQGHNPFAPSGGAGGEEAASGGTAGTGGAAPGGTAGAGGALPPPPAGGMGGGMGPPPPGGMGGGMGGGEPPPPAGGMGGGMGPPPPCTEEADCVEVCPPDARGCTCFRTPRNEQICVPTCEKNEDCPTGGPEPLSCGPEGVCMPAPPMP